jgi:long-chain acyl-CoA synthetase
MNATTIPDLLRQAAARYDNKLALRQPVGKDVKTWTWREYLTAAEEIAAGLRTLGFGNGDHIALCSETRAEFYLADQGILMNGSVAAALYPSYPPEELKRTIAMSDAKALFLEDPKMLKKLKDAPVAHFILMTGEAEGALSLEALRKLGREAGLPPADVSPEDNAILYLTSGATGEPKMVMVTHGSVIANIHMGPVVLPISVDDITIAFLPSAHIAQRVVVEILPILSGTAVSFAESLLKLQPEIKAVRPTFFLAPPRVWERVYSSIRTEILKKPAIAQKAFFGALALGLGAAKYKREGKRVPLRIRVPLQLAQRLIFSKIRDRFGGRLRIAASGAAPLGADLAEFYEAIGMPLIEGYAASSRSIRLMRQGPAVSEKLFPALNSEWMKTANCNSAARLFRVAITRTRKQPPTCSAMAGYTPATSEPSIPTATSTSRAARRNSSYLRTARRSSPRAWKRCSNSNHSSARSCSPETACRISSRYSQSTRQ